MTNQPLGQRLREWREAHGLTMKDVAARLKWTEHEVKWVEEGFDLRSIFDGIIPFDEVCAGINALIAVNPDADQIVAGATAAIRAAVEAGATSVRIVRPETPEHGRVTVIVGGEDDGEWRKWI